MWFALVWLRPLREFWRRELGERQWLELQKVIPYSWIMDPTPIPHHAVIPGLEIQSWSELGEFSQKQRELILKISGFSELAWGSRGVDMAADLPQHEWRAALARALARFDKPRHPATVSQGVGSSSIRSSILPAAGENAPADASAVRTTSSWRRRESLAARRACDDLPCRQKLLHGMRRRDHRAGFSLTGKGAWIAD